LEVDQARDGNGRTVPRQADGHDGSIVNGHIAPDQHAVQEGGTDAEPLPLRAVPANAGTIGMAWTVDRG
jgi:hypothetical protein